MSSTKTAANTFQTEVDRANPNTLPDALRSMKFGTMMTLIKADTGVQAASATWTIAQLLAAAGYVPPGVDGVAPTAARQIKTLRVVASGTGTSVGAYMVTDAGGTPALPAGGANAGFGVATISDDGTTITFPNTVTRVLIEFYPEAAVGMTTSAGNEV